MGVISRKKQSNSGKKEKKVRRTPKWNVDSMLGSLAVNYDASVALISGILIAFGIVMVFSAGYYTTTNFYNDPYYYLRRQLAWVALGICVMALFTRWDYHKYAKYYWVFAVCPLERWRSYSHRWALRLTLRHDGFSWDR